jgi:ribosomal protein L37AE/L43A
MYLPDIAPEQTVTEGTCDRCGEYRTLYLRAGEWICMNCRHRKAKSERRSGA